MGVRFDTARDVVPVFDVEVWSPGIKRWVVVGPMLDERTAAAVWRQYDTEGDTVRIVDVT